MAAAAKARRLGQGQLFLAAGEAGDAGFQIGVFPLEAQLAG